MHTAKANVDTGARCYHSKCRIIFNASLSDGVSISQLHAQTAVVPPRQRLFPLAQDRSWEWNATCQSALVHVKKLLTSKSILTHYNPSWPVQLSCDASAYRIGAVLSHISHGQVHPIAYASRRLTKAEQGYSQLEKEALALGFGIKKFHYYVYARNFTLLTDHKPLETIFGPKTGIPATAAARLQQWECGLQWNVDITHMEDTGFSTKRNYL